MFGNKQIRVGISGQKETGKSTTASLISKYLELGENDIKVAAFADKLKEVFKSMVPWAKDECLYGESELREQAIGSQFTNQDGSPLTHRQGLTSLGKLGRAWCPDLWIMHLDIDFCASQDKKLFIAFDCRMINEFQYLKKNDFYLIRVKRKNISKSSDISETQQEEIPDSAFDWVINNDYSLDELSDEVRRIVEQLRLKTHI